MGAGDGGERPGRRPELADGEGEAAAAAGRGGGGCEERS
jgi:hypothetical protein